MADSRSALEQLLARQREWAGDRLEPDREQIAEGRQLFRTLAEETRREYEKGAGGELRRMRSLRSSSALVCNVFDYWRPPGPDPAPLAAALGISEPIVDIHFEAQCRIFQGGTPPHLDVLITTKSRPIAIESKFAEIYDDPGSSFSSAYFRDEELWTDLSSTRALAERMNRGEFERLDAAQLIKHSLGLRKQFGNDFRLIYLWYEIDSPEAAAHRAEFERFAAEVAGELPIEQMSYQDLFRKLFSCRSAHAEYVDYLEKRYG